MKIICFIFARGNSSGLKNKNLLKFNNMSLIEHTIKQAQKIKRIDKIYISTDSQKIINNIKKTGIEIPFKRPKKLATNRSPEILSWKHAINHLKNKMDIKPDYIISLPVTSPLRSASDIQKCIDLASKKTFDFIFTVNKSNRNPYFNMIKINKKNNNVSIVCKIKKIFRRQDAPECFDMNNACFVFKPNYVLKNKNLLKGKVGTIVMPKHRSLDIDNKYDYNLSKLLFKKKLI